MTDVFSLKIGSDKKKVKIIGIARKPSSDGNPNERFYITAQADDGPEYKINEVWTQDYTGKIVPKSLWMDLDETAERLLATCLLAKFLKYVAVEDVKDLIGKEVLVRPKPNGFMAIVAYDENMV